MPPDKGSNARAWRVGAFAVAPPHPALASSCCLGCRCTQGGAPPEKQTIVSWALDADRPCQCKSLGAVTILRNVTSGPSNYTRPALSTQGVMSSPGEQPGLVDDPFFPHHNMYTSPVSFRAWEQMLRKGGQGKGDALQSCVVCRH